MQLGVAPSTLSRIETGKAPTKSAYLTRCSRRTGSTTRAAPVLVDMAREGHRKGWWAAYDDVLPSGFDIYVGLEAETAAVRGYEISVVHGLLQTPDYARACSARCFPGTAPSRSSAWSTCGMSGSGGSTTTRRSSCGPSSTRRPSGGRSAAPR